MYFSNLGTGIIISVNYRYSAHIASLCLNVSFVVPVLLMLRLLLPNKLIMNISKTCYMTFYSDSVSNSSLVVNRHSVEKVSSCKYLGLII